MKSIVLILGLSLLGCQNNTDRIETLEKEVATLSAREDDTQGAVIKLTEAVVQNTKDYITVVKILKWYAELLGVDGGDAAEVEEVPPAGNELM